MGALDEMRGVMLQDLQARQERRILFLSFAQKVLSVLIAQALSNTIFQIFLVIFGQDNVMLCRSIYAVLITIYSPLVAWLIARKCKCAKGESFVALTLQFHGKVCPVLLAWGWKDWAAQVDTDAGTDLWAELIVASCLTVIIVALQASPRFIEYKKSVAAGGESDTLVARHAIFPASLGLTLGYVWNTVATHPIGQLQKLAAGYHYTFLIQLVYTILAGVGTTMVTLCLSKPDGEKSSVHAHDWSGTLQHTWEQFIGTSLSFVYAWAFSDLMDDWAFGIMFDCESYSACSYQSNFYYSLCVTIFFVALAILLNDLQHFAESAALTKAIALQLNAMMLTVGWAWMNYYTVFMTDATSLASKEVGLVFYVQALAVIFFIASIMNFTLMKTDIGLERKSKHAIAGLTVTSVGDTSKPLDETPSPVTSMHVEQELSDQLIAMRKEMDALRSELQTLKETNLQEINI